MKPRKTTVPRTKPPKRKPAKAQRHRALPPPPPPRKAIASPPRPQLPKRVVARIIDDGDKSLVDVLDSLLNQGVVLNADVVLALADVDLVYIRLSALLCSADRVMPRREV